MGRHWKKMALICNDGIINFPTPHFYFIYMVRNKCSKIKNKLNYYIKTIKLQNNIYIYIQLCRDTDTIELGANNI